MSEEMYELLPMLCSELRWGICEAGGSGTSVGSDSVNLFVLLDKR